MSECRGSDDIDDAFADACTELGGWVVSTLNSGDCAIFAPDRDHEANQDLWDEVVTDVSRRGIESDGTGAARSMEVTAAPGVGMSLSLGCPSVVLECKPSAANGEIC